MNKDTLIAIITNQDPKLAQAVSKMVDYIQDRWAAPYPSKEQTEAVNGKSSVRCPLKPSDSIPLCPNNPAH